MVKLELSNRIRDIENHFDAHMRDLLYQMHWPEDMKHQEIGHQINIPRVTVTRWFRHFDIPVQSCRRFTDKNLTSWLYKSGDLQRKPFYIRLDSRLYGTRNRVDVDFFKKWSPEMSYVLGYFAADGCMFVNPRGSKYVSFTSTDHEILEKVKRMLRSNYKLSVRRRANKNWNDAYVLQIGSKEMYDDLVNQGFMPKKAHRFKLPQMSKKYFRHFIRGYFDGDGSITFGHFKRSNRHNRMTPYLLTSFASANINFLKDISRKLKENIGIGDGCIDKISGHLSYSKSDSIKLFHYMYRNVAKEQYLERKYNKFLKAVCPVV